MIGLKITNLAILTVSSSYNEYYARNEDVEIIEKKTNN